MRRLLVLFFFISWSSIICGQWYGDGLSSATAYYGAINTGNPMQAWNTTNYPGGIIYVGRAASGQNDLEVGTGGTLTIGQGITVKFCTTASDLRITGSGILNASGAQGNMITFTKDIQATWGHISFEASTGNSTINYCVIEYGYKNGTTPSTEGYGGGIHANTSTLSISNCILRNNYALFGGAIFVNTGKNPTISNCYILNNQSLHGGGGIYCWNSSSSVIINCIIQGNACLEPSVSYYTGGGLTAQTSCAIKVVNCTFVNNTSTRPEGQALLLHGSSNSRVINSIFWGNQSRQIYCYGTTANIIINSAYRGITYSTGSPSNCIILDSDNSASNGPNFIATDGSDWSIKYVSPCRDAGINSYTGVTIPATDYAGNNRVMTVDIGAYEVQYSRWKTTAISNEWNNAANWDGGIPISESNVLIPSGATNYPTGSTTQDFTISNGRLFVLDPGSSLTLHDLTNNGTLQLNSTSAGSASIIINNYAQGSGGTEEIQLYLTGGGNSDEDSFKWHYISTPVSSLPVNTFAPGTTLDVAQWIESRPTASLMQGWVAYDGYVYATGSMGGPTFSDLTPGKGYDYWDNADNTFTFSGILNTSDVVVNLGYSGSPKLNGFNLLGNPFSSGLNWDDISNGVYFAYPANTSKSVYFTRDNLPCSYINGVGIPSDVNGIIPPMQGFFVKTSSTGNSITLPAAARTHGDASNPIHPTYKSISVIPLVRLSISEDPASTDETVVRFNNQAQEGLDNDFDAVKMFLSSTKTAIYSTTTANDNMAINGLPFPASSVEVPITVNLTTNGTHKITAKQVQGLDGYSIKLVDNVNGSVIDLRENPDFTFTSDMGSISDRFKLRINVKSVQTISFNQIATKTFGDADFNPGATASSSLPITYTSDNPSVAVVINNSVHITGAGTVNIIAQQPGSSDYLPANDIAVPLIVNKAAQIITFNPISPKVLTDTDFDPGAISNSGLPVEYSSSNMSVAIITDGKIHITGAGTSTITASQPGNTNYNSAASVSQDLTVSLATSVPEILNGALVNQFNVYSSGSDINIEPLSEDWDGKTGQIEVFTLSGLVIKTINDAGFNKGALIQIPVAGKGMFIVNIKSGLLRYTGRVVIR